MKSVNKTENSEDTIKWSENGHSFVIVNQDNFVKIMPKYFKTTRYLSFVRQLSMYRFKKIKNNQKMDEFYHQKFRRDNFDLVKTIHRRNYPNAQKNNSGQKELKSIIQDHYMLQQEYLELNETVQVLKAGMNMNIQSNKNFIKEIYEQKNKANVNIRKLLFMYFFLATNYKPEIFEKIKNEFLRNSDLKFEGEDVVLSLKVIDKFVHNLSQEIVNDHSTDNKLLDKLTEILQENNENRSFKERSDFHSNESLPKLDFEYPQLFDVQNQQIHNYSFEELGKSKKADQFDFNLDNFSRENSETSQNLFYNVFADPLENFIIGANGENQERSNWANNDENEPWDTPNLKKNI